MLQNQKGSVTWLLLLFVLAFCVFGIFSVKEERVLLAAQIESGDLIETLESKKWLDFGDEMMAYLRSKRYRNRREREWMSYIGKEDIARVFYAKVCFERAKLEMEIEAIERLTSAMKKK